MELALVSCIKSKREQAETPADLYMESAFFRKAGEYIEANHDSWYILSVKHHLLDSNGPPIDPYDETLSGAPVGRNLSGRGQFSTNYRERDCSQRETKCVPR